MDEHAERLWLPQRHAKGIKAMLRRHQVNAERGFRSAELKTRPLELIDLRRFVAGADAFSRQSDGTTVAGQYAKLDIRRRASLKIARGSAQPAKRSAQTEGRAEGEW